MAKYQYTETNSNIQFNSVDTSLMGVSKKVGNTQNRNADANVLSEIAEENGGKLPTIVNAVEIDWNGAKPGIGEGENGITTTGELLSSIKGVYSPMFAN